MRKIVWKVILEWDYVAEERWLNEMAADGWALVSTRLFRYEFEKTEPGEYAIRMQKLENGIKHPKSKKYLEFIREMGIEVVGSLGGWVYLRKKTADGPFELFSDKESRIKHLTNIIYMFAALAGVNLAIGIVNVAMYAAMKVPFNLFGMVNLLVGASMCWYVKRLLNNRKRLKKEQQIYE